MINKRYISKVSTLGIFACLLVAASLYKTMWQPLIIQATAWIVAAGIGLAITLMISPTGQGRFYRGWQDRTPSYPQEYRHIRWIPVVLGAALLAVLAEINGNFFDPSPLDHISSLVQWVLWLVAPVLFAWGIAGYKRHDAENADLKSAPTVWRFHREWLCIGLVLILAAAVRFWHLGTAVPYFVDEIHFAKPVGHFYTSDGQYIELLKPFSNVAAFPYLYPYMQWLSVEVFGHTLAGLRFISAVFGVLNVLALYLLARELFDRKTALIAAALLAVFPPHVHFSRLGLNNIADPFFGMMALYFITRGLQPGRSLRWNFAFAGMFLGWTQYFYEGGRLLFPPLVFIWLASGILIGCLKEHGVLKVLTPDFYKYLKENSKVLSAASVLGFVAVIVGILVYYTLLGHERGLTARLEKTAFIPETISKSRDVLELLQHLASRLNGIYLAHVMKPEFSLYYAGNTPLILNVLVPFFLLGMLFALWSIFTRHHYWSGLLIVNWVLLVWLGNTIMLESRVSARHVVAFPAIILAVAVGIRYLIDILIGEFPRIQNLILTGIVLFLVHTHITYYFNEHVPTFNAQFRVDNLPDANDALMRAAEFPDDTMVYLIANPPFPNGDAVDLLRFMNDKVSISTKFPIDMNDGYMQTLVPSEYNWAFFIDASEVEAIEMIHTYFPNIQGPFYSPREDISRQQQYALYWSERVQD